MRKSVFAVAAVGVALVAAPALAHHSVAMFDMKKDVVITGVVKEFQYTNPHSWLYVVGADETGKEGEWGFEGEGPSTLLRSGIKKSSVATGEKVVVKGHPMRDGRTAAALVSITKTSGEVLSQNPTLRKPATVAAN
ncbi:MAG: DUF6152 family protein [Caulobacteraceae bacterium]